MIDIIVVVQLVQMSFTAINSRTCLVYCESDKNSGRCRIHRKTFGKLKATIGNVAQIRLTFADSVSCEVLCTLWPERDDSAEELELCLDPSVVLCGKIMDQWTSCLADVIQISPRKPCSSVYIHPININMKEFEKMSGVSLLGLAVSSGCTVTNSTNTVTIR